VICLKTEFMDESVAILMRRGAETVKKMFRWQLLLPMSFLVMVKARDGSTCKTDTHFHAYVSICSREKKMFKV